jgi:hypothetical protein
MTTDVAINEIYISTASLILMATSKCKNAFYRVWQGTMT